MRDRHLTQFVGSVAPGTRYERARNSGAKNQYLCHLNHRFTASTSVLQEFRGSDGCRYCARRAPLAGFNTLADTHPWIAVEWHTDVGGHALPTDVLSGSSKLVRWRCPVGHLYERTVALRVRGQGCKECAATAGDQSFAVTHSTAAAEWHRTLNLGVTPADVTAESTTSRWWICAASAHIYEMSPQSRARGAGCRRCRRGARPSLAESHPAVAALWHKSRNAGLMPSDVLASSPQRVWFTCAAGHDVERAVTAFVRRPECDRCALLVTSAEESMAYTHPRLSAEFDRRRNTGLTPETVSASTTVVLWWRCARKHRWEASGKRRVEGGGHCLVCTNRRVVVGENDMATTHPELAAQLDPVLNFPVTAHNIVAGTAKRLVWRCERNPKHVWEATGQQRTRGRGCSGCSGRHVLAGMNDMATTHPVIAADFDERNNGSLKPQNLLATTSKSLHWVCVRGHRARESGRVRTARGGCKECLRCS
ncbi:zinc-ribbon domain-containing protein [Microbacterium sp. C5A9]|uniref:zinc-ribbon domain-containing protein n=1 Tax=Microbacterium sp. C5A9 TaxID=2736663 RepID=UPI0035AB8DC7